MNCKNNKTFKKTSTTVTNVLIWKTTLEIYVKLDLCIALSN
jgi:hypothetical protein